MNIRQFTFKLSPMALAIGLCLPLSYAQASTPIEFDPDGPGPLSVVSVGSFDWAVGNALVGDAIPVDQLVPDADGNISVQVFGQTMLAGMHKPDGNPGGLDGLNVDYEITVVNSLRVKLQVSGQTVLFSQYDNPPVEYENYFEIYYDDSPDADPLSGTGFDDGQRILYAPVTQLSGNFTVQSFTPVNLDQFGTNNWVGTQTVSGDGGQNMNVLVLTTDGYFFDTDFFTSGVDHGTNLPFNNSQVIAFNQTNPSRTFSGHISNVGDVNGDDGPDLLLQIDPNSAFEFIPAPQACRVTGGGNDTAGLFPDGTLGWDETVAQDISVIPVQTNVPVPTNKNGKVIGKKVAALEPPPPYDYSMGGQAGANTAKQPQPKGEWTHSNHDGPDGLDFTFHAGTASAPDGTEIDEIICTDPGWCRQARPAPNKQIDFVGVGTFKNLKYSLDYPDGSPTPTYSIGVVNEAFYNIQIEPAGNKPGQDPATQHWFQVHIEDLGEPGVEKKAADTAECPLVTEALPGVFIPGHGNDPFNNPPITDYIADCDCADFYHIKIYAGVVPEFDEDGNVTNINKDDVIYEVYGYIDGGNFQIHPLTGFDLK